MESIDKLSKTHWEWLQSVGWDKSSVLEGLTLVLSEIGEAANEVRGDNPTENFGSELADIILRLMGLSGKTSLLLDSTLIDYKSHSWVKKESSFLEQLAYITPYINKCIESEIGFKKLNEFEWKKNFSLAINTTFLIAENAGINLESEIDLKMKKNLSRGTRGRKK